MAKETIQFSLALPQKGAVIPFLAAQNIQMTLPFERAVPGQVVSIQNNADQLFFKALTLDESGQTEAAMQMYSEILMSNPNHASALLNLGVMYFHKGLFITAQSCFFRLVNLYPAYALAWYNLGNTCSKLKDYSGTVASYKEAIRLAPENPDAYNNLALEYEEAKEPGAALAMWRSYCKLNCSGVGHEHAHQKIKELLSVISLKAV